MNVDKDYKLEQTLDDHSSAITSVKFAGRWLNRIRIPPVGLPFALFCLEEGVFLSGFTYLNFNVCVRGGSSVENRRLQTKSTEPPVGWDP